MKTTGGKTKTRRPARKIQIFHGKRLMNERSASSLRQALLEFSKEKHGKCGVVVGNVLTVDDVTVYVAREAK